MSRALPSRLPTETAAQPEEPRALTSREPSTSSSSLASTAASRRLQRSSSRLDRHRLDDHHTSAAAPSSSAATSITLLSGLDDQLVEALRTGAIRLLRTSWLRVTPLLRLPRRQDLEALDDAVFMSLKEAVSLIRGAKRRVAALTHSWLSIGDPDPLGTRLPLVRRALLDNEHIDGLFWGGCTIMPKLSHTNFP